MLDQENQSKMAVEPATNNSVNNNNSTIIDSNNKLSNSDCTFYNNLLNDHDYCSPNKNSSHRQSEPTNIIKTQQPQTNDKSLEGVGHKSKTSTTNAPECHASTSSSPSEYKDGSKSDAKMHEKMTTNDDDDAMSDDSISSSSIVSDDSIMDLIIPPDGNERKARSLAPKDTPSVSKPKLGRRPVLKTDFEIGKLKSNQKQKQKQPRPKRPRQNTSVTDKSQWITGEEQIESALSEHLNDNDKKEKRQRKEVHDPLFSHFTSSEYSSSDAESDKYSECGSEGDPDKLWCICNQPDDGKFMICCDICEYWFHGGCVGMTDSLLKSRQAHSKEWFCPDCDHAIQSGTPRNAIPLKIVKKEKKKSSSKTTGKRRGRPRKSTTPTREISTRLSLRSAKKMDESLESRSSAGRGPTKSRARSESYEKFENPERLKELIRERKKEFFLKHRLSEQHKAEKIRELGIGRKSLTASLGNSLDSLATSTNSPNMNNLPINIKSEHQDRKKPNIVLHINTKKDRGSLPGSGQRIVTIVNKRRHSESKDPSADESLATDPILNNKKIKREVDEEKSSTGLSETPPADSTEKNIDVKVDARKETSSTSINKSPDPSLIQNNKEIENGVNIPTTTKSPINASEENSTQVDKTIKIETALEQNTTKPNSPSPTENTSSTSNNNKDRAEKVKPCVSSNEPCWSGTIVMPDVGKFTAIAKPVSGNSDFMQNDINQNLIICGRIAPEQVNSYIKKLKSTTKNQIVLVQLYPSTENDKPSFDTLFDYLYTRNRCGVINNSAPSQILKDFYILPVHEKSSIPEILKPIDGPGLDRKAPNCLVGILVKTKRPPSASSSASSYTPTPIS